MADTKELLEEGSIDEIIDSVEVKQASFSPEGENRKIDYNYILVTLTNGDTIRLKADKGVKASIWFARKGTES